MEKTLEELDHLAKEYGFGGAHNATTCAKGYRSAYSEYLHKYEEMEKVFNALREILPSSLMQLVDERRKELEKENGG